MTKKRKKYKSKRKKKFKDAYDVKCLSILSYKRLLAHIMKNILIEYKHLDLESIVKCIEKQYPKNEKIVGLPTNFKYLDYDLFFTSALPNSNESIGLLINLEPQKTSQNLGYNIFNRSLFYASNAIVYQYNRFFKKSKYDLIKKVYSIFICFDAPTKEEENSITYFHLTKDIKVGYNIYEDYDKLCMIVIYMGENSSEDDLLSFIELLFTSELNADEIVKKLDEDFDIQLNEPFIEEVHEMCNLSDRVEKRGYTKGIKQGIEQGIEEGIKQGNLSTTILNLKNLMETMHVTLDEAIQALKIDEELAKECRKAILNN